MFSSNQSKSKTHPTYGAEITEEPAESDWEFIANSRSVSWESKDSADSADSFVKVNIKEKRSNAAHHAIKAVDSANERTTSKSGDNSSIELGPCITLNMSIPTTNSYFRLYGNGKSVSAPDEAFEDNQTFKDLIDKHYPDMKHLHVSILSDKSASGNFYRKHQVHKCIRMLAQVADRCAFSFQIQVTDDWRLPYSCLKTQREEVIEGITNELHKQVDARFGSTVALRIVDEEGRNLLKDSKGKEYPKFESINGAGAGDREKTLADRSGKDDGTKVEKNAASQKQKSHDTEKDASTGSAPKHNEPTPPNESKQQDVTLVSGDGFPDIIPENQNVFLSIALPFPTEAWTGHEMYMTNGRKSKFLPKDVLFKAGGFEAFVQRNFPDAQKINVKFDVTDGIKTISKGKDVSRALKTLLQVAEDYHFAFKVGMADTRRTPDVLQQCAEVLDAVLNRLHDMAKKDGVALTVSTVWWEPGARRR